MDRSNSPYAACSARWYVAHTKPRCEKRLREYCERLGLESTLPLYRSVKQYRGKTVVFHKPLFPNYLFLRLVAEQRPCLAATDYLARLLAVPDQDEFQSQLQDIQRALEANVEIRLAPCIVPGSRVRIRAGPLQGVEAWVEDRLGMSEVLLRLDFIGQAAAVKLDAELLELI